GRPGGPARGRSGRPPGRSRRRLGTGESGLLRAERRVGGPPPPLHARIAARALHASRPRGRAPARLGLSRLDLLPPPHLRAATLVSRPGPAALVPAAGGGRARRCAPTRPPAGRRRARRA